MSLLRLAGKKQRWDLAAHAIVLAAARILEKGERPDAGKRRREKGSAEGQSERQETRVLF